MGNSPLTGFPPPYQPFVIFANRCELFITTASLRQHPPHRMAPHTRSRNIPVSLVLSPDQLAWLDQQRIPGGISRSAALRIALTQLIDQQPLAAPHLPDLKRRGR
jgi:hypothetical protein